MESNSCWIANVSCFLLAVTYVGSLYMWKSNEDRNHPNTVKRRFISAFIMLFVAPIAVYFTLRMINPQDPVSLYSHLGLKLSKLPNAIVLPLLLTVVLFLGPITVSFLDGSWRNLLSVNYWKNNVNDILWIRNQIVAPISEEFTFRSCMVPQLLLCYSSSQAMITSPLFFGVGHFHHMVDRCRNGMPIFQSFLIACFQFTYTTLFGIYASFLFIRTGHFAAPCVAHAFCNGMGFPDFTEIVRQEGFRRLFLISTFLAGLIAWYYLLMPMTDSSLYT